MTWQDALSRRWFWIVIVMAWAWAYLPGLGARDLRLEEGRRAIPAREMLQSQDFVRPTLFGDTYLHKPPGFPWVIALFGTLLGEVSTWAVRLPSALAALATAFVVTTFATKDLDRSTRHLAGLLTLAATTMLDKGTLGEIDPTLTLVLALQLKFWWDNLGRSAPSRRDLWIGWFIQGALLGVAVLLKGPAGPALFYLAIIPFLVWQRRARELFCLPHVVSIFLAALPTAVWVGLLLHRDVVSARELGRIWLHQVGAGTLVGAVPREEDGGRFVLMHYVTFPVQLAVMVFPAVCWLGAPLRSIRSAINSQTPMIRFLACAAFVPAIVFWLYPESRPRHVMPVVVPACVLGAIGMLASKSTARLWPASGVAWSIVMALTGLAGVAYAATRDRDDLPLGITMAVVAMAISISVARRARQSTGPVAAAVPLMLTMCVAWGIVNAIVFPHMARGSTMRQAWLEFDRHVEPDEWIYTTRRYPYRADGLYNLHFHIARRLRGIDANDLPSDGPVKVLIDENELLSISDQRRVSVLCSTPTSTGRRLLLVRLGPAE